MLCVAYDRYPRVRCLLTVPDRPLLGMQSLAHLIRAWVGLGVFVNQE